MATATSYLDWFVNSCNEMNLNFHGISVIFTDEIVMIGLRKICSEREQHVFSMRCVGYSFEEIGQDIGVTRSRAAQILHKTERKIQKGWIQYYTIPAVDVERIIQKELSMQQAIYNGKNINEYSIIDFIRDANLSVRTSNCIIHSGVKTVQELIDLTPDEVMKWRNLGNKSYIELENALRRIGLSFSEKIHKNLKR